MIVEMHHDMTTIKLKNKKQKKEQRLFTVVKMCRSTTLIRI